MAKPACLSGGYRTGYDCGAPIEDKAIAVDTASLYTLQLLWDNQQDTAETMSQKMELPLLYTSGLGGDQKLLYLGRFKDLDTAKLAMANTILRLGYEAVKYRPLLVEYTHAEPFPRISFVEGANVVSYENLAEPDYIEPSALIIQTEPVSQNQNNAMSLRDAEPLVLGDDLASTNAKLEYGLEGSLEAIELNDDVTVYVADEVSTDEALPAMAVKSGVEPKANFSPVFTLQIAVFKTVDSQLSFARQQGALKPLCRQRTDGRYGVYTGRYPSKVLARGFIEASKRLQAMGAYVLKLEGSDLLPCVIK